MPPSTAARPAAAIEQAEPTSPWQPTSAPEIDALRLEQHARSRLAVSRNSTMPSSLGAGHEAASSSAAPPGMMPAAPLVGAVTTRPPPAFSSLTASAYTVEPVHRVQRIVGVAKPRASKRARRRTRSAPGRVPVAARPASTHSRIAAQIRSRPARRSGSRPRADSLRAISAAMLHWSGVREAQRVRPRW